MCFSWWSTRSSKEICEKLAAIFKRFDEENKFKKFIIKNQKKFIGIDCTFVICILIVNVLGISFQTFRLVSNHIRHQRCTGLCVFVFPLLQQHKSQLQYKSTTKCSNRVFWCRFSWRSRNGKKNVASRRKPLWNISTNNSLTLKNYLNGRHQILQLYIHITCSIWIQCRMDIVKSKIFFYNQSWTIEVSSDNMFYLSEDRNDTNQQFWFIP